MIGAVIEEPPTGAYIGRAEAVKKSARCHFPSFRRKPVERSGP
jgi:hypothetical protein